MCDYVMMYGGCCFVAGPFDWYGQRHAATQEVPPGAFFFPTEHNECEWLIRAPTQYPNDDAFSATIGWWTSQDSTEGSWAIRFESSGDDADLEFRLGRINQSVAPYAGSGETLFTRRDDVGLLTLESNELAALSSWTVGGSANFSGGRLSANADVTDDDTVQISHSFTAPSNGNYRLIVEGTADEATWIYVKVTWGGFNSDTELWIDLSAETSAAFGANTTGVNSSSLRHPLGDDTKPGVWVYPISPNRYNAKKTISGASSPSVLIRLVDGNNDTNFTGSNGDGVNDLVCELREETIQSPAVWELARFDVDESNCDWRIDLTTDEIYDVTGTVWEGTQIDGLTEQGAVSGGILARTTGGYGVSGYGVIDGVPEANLPSIGWGNFYGSAGDEGANETEFIFAIGDNGANSGAGDAVITFGTDGAITWEAGTGEAERGYIEGVHPAISTYPDDAAGGPTYYYEPVYDDNPFLTMIVGWAARAGGIVCGIRYPRATHHEDSSTTPPLPETDPEEGGGTWYRGINVTDYAAICIGPYRQTTYPFRDSGDPALYGLSKWDADWNGTGGGIPVIQGPGASTSGTGYVLWDDEYEQLRLVFFSTVAGGFHDWPSTEEPWICNGRAYSGRPHAWCNSAGQSFDAHGDAADSKHAAAIFTTGRAVYGISGTYPWESWDEGEVPIAAPTENSPTDTYYLKVAMGLPGHKGVGEGRVVYSQQIWRDADRFWYFNVSAIQAREGTSDQAFILFEKLYEGETPDPPDEAGAGTQTGTRIICRTAAAVRWYLDTDATSNNADCIASSDRWIYVSGFDKDNDAKTSWAFSQEPADSGDASAGPLYAHFASYDPGAVTHLPFTGGAGTTTIDSVKRSGLVPQSPAVQDYS